MSISFTKCKMKLFIFSQTASVQQLTYGNGYVISTNDADMRLMAISLLVQVLNFHPFDNTPLPLLMIDYCRYDCQIFNQICIIFFLSECVKIPVISLFHGLPLVAPVPRRPYLCHIQHECPSSWLKKWERYLSNSRKKPFGTRPVYNEYITNFHRKHFCNVGWIWCSL